MYQTNQNKTLRSALLLGAASAAALSLAAPAMAQDSGSVETVVVTGSRIPQTGLYSSSPVTAVGQQEIKFEGTTDASAILNQLPSVFAGQNSFEGNGSSGTSEVDLRGLGASRTLVLVDGKRLAPGDPNDPVPDVNQVPTNLIDHVEVLTGGASAVYGSDAVAGVVNFILRKDFEGVEADGTFSGYQHNNDNSRERGMISDADFAEAPSNVFDGQGVNGSLLFGINSADGKGNVTGYLGYKHNQQVLQSARDYSACAVSSSRSGGSGTPYDTLRCAGSANYSLYYGVTGPAAGGNYYFMSPGGALTPYIGGSTETFNYGRYNSMLRPDERYTGGFFAHYDVNKQLELYSSFMFMDDHSTWQAAQSGLFFGAGPVSGAVQVNCGNPLVSGTDFYNDFCDTPTSTATVYVGRRNVEGGPRVTDYRHTSYRALVGAKGDLGDGWSYDLSAQYSTTMYQEAYLNDLSISRVENALNSDTCATIPTCVPLDIFHGIGAITPAMENYITTHGQQNGSTQEQVVSANLVGDLGAWGIQSPWAKSPVSVSLGSEYRAEYLELLTSDADQQGDLYGAGGAAPSQPHSGFNVVEGYGEIQIPLIQGLPFVEDFTLHGGYRYSSYSTAGSVTAWKASGEWAITDDVKLRGGFNRAVRAPNVLELFSPQNQVLGDASWNDPCATASPDASATQCALMGVSPAQYGHIIQCPADQCGVLAGGNTALHPEVANTFTAGIVLTPTFLDGFTATIDYYAIHVSNFVGSISPNTVISECLGGDTSLCSLVHRTPNGLLFGTGGYVINTNINTGYLGEKGVDFEANYNVELADWGANDVGSLSFHFIGTWLDDYTTRPYNGATSYNAGNMETYKNYDCSGLFGTSCGSPNPAWRHQMRVTWSTPWDFDLSLNWRHYSSVEFAGNSDNTFLSEGSLCGATTCTPLSGSAGGHIPAYDYFDLAGNWNVSQQVQLRAGVNNIFDKNPPLEPTGGLSGGPTEFTNGNTFAGTYDPLGRYIFVGGTVKF